MANMINQPCDEAVIHAAPDRRPHPPSVGRWVLVATILGSSMAMIDGTAVNVALPVLEKSLNATIAETQWIVEIYALFLAALILVGGSLGDVFGRKRFFAIGVALFALASICCGLSQTTSQLIIARAIQGIGGALLIPGSLSMIGSTFSKEQRGRAVGTWSGFTMITGAAGPVLGGWIVENISWRGIFFLNVPLAIVVLLIIFWRVPESRDERASHKIDWWGGALITLALGSIVYGLITSNVFGLGSSVVIMALILGVAALLAFLLREDRSQTPMVPLTLFRSRTFSGINILTLFLYSAVGGVLFFFPFNLIQVQGYAPVAAGAALLPMILISFLLSRWSGGLINRYGAKLPLVIGPLLVATAFLLYTRPGIGGSYWLTFFPAIVVQGFGVAITVAPLTTTAMSAVESKHVGLAAGISNTVSRTAALLSVAVLNIVFLATFTSTLDSQLATLKLPPAIRQQIDAQQTKLAEIQIPASVSGPLRSELSGIIASSFVTSFRVIMLIAFGLALASSLTALIMINVPRVETGTSVEVRNSATSADLSVSGQGK
ncbi:MFS transporter [Dictyobacter arantiisoli]|uniref:MFS transporter n=1 Tax=Dictyobacter arantiisoli TaxID=2014874 RepID=A0A5A5TK41_9CHLR|nr:MFS transporter [Dictyobacter arantiisoli]GCF11990.1 MFS transporter [Dictyobacter arantiisoli]